MKFKLGMAVGAGVGYLVGSGKGRELIERARDARASRSNGAAEPFDVAVSGSSRRGGTITGSDDPMVEPSITTPPIGTGIV